jgi:hypothetical protein
LFRESPKDFWRSNKDARRNEEKFLQAITPTTCVSALEKALV